MRDLPERRKLLRKCKEDPVFFVNGFCVVQKPKPLPKNLPMVLYPRQLCWLWMLAANIGRSDIHCRKSREMGISWLTVQELLRWWLFVPGAKFLIASWKERLVYHPGDMDALFTKLEFLLDHLPKWMRPKVKKHTHQKKLRLLNPANAAVITGEATVENLGRAGRQTAILLDEAGHMAGLAAILEGTTDTTDCRILQSTPTYAAHEFSQQRHKCPNRFVFWWPDHPIKAEGLYGEGLGKKPASGWWSDDVEELRGKLRSPWYDARCKRALSKGEIATQVEIDDEATGHRFFDEEVLGGIIEDYCRPAFHEGELIGGRFMEARKIGALKLWLHPGANGLPPLDRRYVAGCDVASGSRDEAGRGLSNSCCAVFDGKTGALVAEYTVHGIPPDEFAHQVVAICKWFSGKDETFLGWEGNGPGQFFQKVVMEDEGYGAVYYRQQENKAGRPQTAQPGWWSTPNSKFEVFCELLQALKEGWMVERNIVAVREMRQYQVGVRTVFHVSAEVETDPTQARDNHGDRVIARAVAWRCLDQIGYHGDSPLPGSEPSDNSMGEKGGAPFGSPAWAREHSMDRYRDNDLARY